MRKIGYNSIRVVLKGLLFLYFGKITVNGKSNIPRNKPVLFLSNHQNAFLDTILIGTDCNRSPYFLARSDVFKNGILKVIFTFFRMIPIYRIRDGLDSLKNNQRTFTTCSILLNSNEAVVIFPEGNHNLKRRVRSLSKGFTRVLFSALKDNPELDIQLVPVGLNYKNAAGFPDKASVCYGKAIPIQTLYNVYDEQTSMLLIKKVVFESLKTLTTHIQDDENYFETIKKLDALGADYLKPNTINDKLLDLTTTIKMPDMINGIEWLDALKKTLFNLINFPVVILWHKLVKPKIKEPEFISTFRFAFAIGVYPFYYLVLFVASNFIWNLTIATLVIVGIFAFNILYTKSN